VAGVRGTGSGTPGRTAATNRRLRRVAE